MSQIQLSVNLPVSAKNAFEWHSRLGAFTRLLPPWERLRMIQAPSSLESGQVARFAVRLAPLVWRQWVAEHFNYEPPSSFSDRQISGPFRAWTHEHRFHGTRDHKSILTDAIEYSAPCNGISLGLANRIAAKKIAAMFRYRHRVTRNDLAFHAQHESQPRLRVAITGASGLLGRQLAAFLTTGGHEVTEIVRRPTNSPNQLYWNPCNREIEREKLEGHDAVIHLAGENIAARRWSRKQMQRITDSRVEGTKFLSQELAKLDQPPATFISASAIGFYGDTGNIMVTEDSPSDDGRSFLGSTAIKWEAATRPASDQGIRVVHSRFSMILTAAGGALASMLTPFRLGAGGPIGNGRQNWSWVSLHDAVQALTHVLYHPEISGPVNITAPHPETNHNFTKTLGRVLGRPAFLPLPAVAARMMLGKMANDLLLCSCAVMPTVLQKTGYVFREPYLNTCLQNALGQPLTHSHP